MYYNANRSGAFTVTARVTDTDSGVKYMRFPATTSSGVFSNNLSTGGLYGWKYVFPGTLFSNTAIVTAGNIVNRVQLAQFRVISDGLAPSLAVMLPAKTQTSTVAVSWSASDTVSGLKGGGTYTVSVMTDTGPLQPWLNSVTATSANFPGEFGHHYTFVVTTTDNVGNVSQAQAETFALRVTKYYYIGSSRVAMRQGSTVTYLHTDHLGTVSIATNQSQVVLARTLNLPYGGVRWTSGTMPTDWGYTGQREPVGTGLVYLHARFYAPWAGGLSVRIPLCRRQATPEPSIGCHIPLATL